MGMMKNRREEVGRTRLAPPGLPQAVMSSSGYVLDLQAPSVTDKGAVEISIPRHLERNLGDWVTVLFNPISDEIGDRSEETLRRYLYLADPTRDPPGHEYSVLIQPLRAVAADDYEVCYMVTSRSGNASVSVGVPVSVINATANGTAIGQTNLYGTYEPGPVASWVVANEYKLAPSGVLLRSLDKPSTSNISLGIYRKPIEGPEQLFARLNSADGVNWTPDRNDVIEFQRGDLINIRLETSQNSAIYLAVAM